MTISSPQKANKVKLNLRNIEEKNYIKYLGIYMDKNLNWAPHAHSAHKQQNIKKLKNPFQITRFLNFKHPQTNILLTFLPLPSLWNYELGKHIPIRLTRVQTKQNKCTRSIFLSTIEKVVHPTSNF